MKSLMLVAVAMIMTGCISSSKECKPRVEFVKQKFPVMETVEINTTIDIPTYKIEREKIKVVDDVNVTMGIDTFRRVKEGDELKVQYLLQRLKVFMFGVEVLNSQAKKYNEEFVYGE